MSVYHYILGIFYVLSLLTIVYCGYHETQCMGILFMIYMCCIVVLSTFIIKKNIYFSICVTLGIGILMTIVESICISHKIWYYNFAKSIVPLWLPFAWSIVTIFILQISFILFKNQYN